MFRNMLLRFIWDLKMIALRTIYGNEFPWISELVLNICKSCLENTSLTTPQSTGWAKSLTISTLDTYYPSQKHMSENRNYTHTPNMHQYTHVLLSYIHKHTFYIELCVCGIYTCWHVSSPTFLNHIEYKSSSFLQSKKHLFEETEQT